MKGAVRDTLRRHFRARGLLMAITVVLLFGLLALDSRGFARDRSPEAALARVAARRGVAVDTASVVWLGPSPGPLHLRGVIFAGAEEGELTDIYFARVRGTEDGVLLGLYTISNLTRTSGAAEHHPVRSGHHLAFLSRTSEGENAVTVLSLEGEDPEVTADWPMRARLQNGVTNLQDTGRWHGFGWRRYTLDEPAERARLEAREDGFVLEAGERRVVFAADALAPLEGADAVEARETAKAEPGTITWVVDTVRNLSFVGPEPIAWLEHRVFAVKDWLERTWYRSVGTVDTETEVAEEMDVTPEESRRRAELAVTDPELGWPPAKLSPVVSRPAAGEGEWVAVIDDPFVASYPNAPPAFYTTFLQVDPDRPFTRVYIVLWDPRQVQLRVMTGTREPESATGETGPGLIPRDPETLRRLVGAFNGGFQALHGEFGMMSEGRVYLPPKPWAATVAVFRDGTVGMGSWQEPPEGVRAYEEGWATRQIPEAMVEFRQNLTSVVEDGRYNPWRRWWWGAAPRDAEDQVFIDRSGVCLTEGGFMAYFWGKSMGADELGEAMLATRCVRGMHLDMNQRHTAFEFYDVRRADDPFEPIRPRTGQFEIPVPLAENFVARGRLLVRTMSPMRFPRYIRRDARDFFYLTLKPTLPGPHLPGADEHSGEGVFSTAGLPHAGWPHAFARAFVGRSDGAQTWLVRIDPARVDPDRAGGEEARLPLAWITGPPDASPPADGSHGIYADRRVVGRRYRVGAIPEGVSPLLTGAALTEGSDARAAMGVDADGFLVYAERQSDDAPSLVAALQRAGVERAIALPDGVRLAFEVDGTAVAPDAYERPVDRARALALRAHDRAAAEVLNPEVRPRPYMHWYRMQDTRVRYFLGEGPRRFAAPDPSSSDGDVDAGRP